MLTDHEVEQLRQWFGVVEQTNQGVSPMLARIVWDSEGNRIPASELEGATTLRVADLLDKLDLAVAVVDAAREWVNGAETYNDNDYFALFGALEAYEAAR